MKNGNTQQIFRVMRLVVVQGDNWISTQVLIPKFLNTTLQK